MPRSWTAKDERMYDHIVESEKESGSNDRKAKEIAARTVNKHRREEGRTENKRTMGTGNPNTPLAERSRDELYNLAKEQRIAGRSRMTKAELLKVVKK